MRKFGYAIGWAMLIAFALVVLVRFIAKHGWEGVAFLSFLATMGALLTLCAPRE